MRIGMLLLPVALGMDFSRKKFFNSASGTRAKSSWREKHAASDGDTLIWMTATRRNEPWKEWVHHHGLKFRRDPAKSERNFQRRFVIPRTAAYNFQRMFGDPRTAAYQQQQQQYNEAKQGNSSPSGSVSSGPGSPGNTTHSYPVATPSPSATPKNSAPSEGESVLFMKTTSHPRGENFLCPRERIIVNVPANGSSGRTVDDEMDEDEKIPDCDKTLCGCGDCTKEKRGNTVGPADPTTEQITNMLGQLRH